jgi:NDP-sugar pyrophosphorylase family protein
MALVAHAEVERYGSVTLSDGRVTSIAGRCGPGGVGEEALGTVFTGIHVMDPGAQALLPRQGCVVRETFFSMLERGMEIAGYLHEGSWSDVGTPAEYLRCNLELAGGRLVGENVTVGDARLGPDVVIGDGAVVEDGADLSSCVVWDGATARGRLHRAIVGREHVVRIEEVT